MRRGVQSAIRRRIWALTVFSFAALAEPAAASHFRYGTMSWEPTGIVPGEVEFRVVGAFRRDEYSGSGPDGKPVTGNVIQELQGPTAFAFGDGNFSDPLFFRITSYSVTENWITGEAVTPVTLTPNFRHTYAGTGPFVAYLLGIGNGPPPVDFPACCRIGQIGFPTTDQLANRSGLPYPLQTTVFPFSGNRSPVSSMVPIVVVPPSADATFLVPAVDPDNDPITFRLSTDVEAGGPAPPPNMSIESTTGIVHWNTIGLTQAPVFWTTQFMVEDHDVVALQQSSKSLKKQMALGGRHLARKQARLALAQALGPAKTRTPVDFLLLIRPQVGNLPTCSISPAGPLTASVGDPF